VRVGRYPVALRSGSEGLWVTNSGDATVTILDPTSGATATIPVGSGPLAATPAGGSVWVVNSVDATVTRASWAAPDDE